MSNQKFEAGLEDIGVAGPNFLRNALTSCTDPLKAIEEFQVIYPLLKDSLFKYKYIFVIF